MTQLIRILTILTNLGFLVFMFFIALTESLVAEELIMVPSLIVLFSLNIYYIIQSKGGEDWLSLWFKRKRLEEEKKIENLS